MTAAQSWSSCPDCGKVRYGSKAMAKASARRMKHRKGKLNAYRCGAFWHLGHLPDDVRHGVISRDALRPRRYPATPEEA